MTGPRLSIIPAGAVVDSRLEGRDLQVLALLGTYTNKLGWCYRSQAEMAKQLGSGRATVQRSLDRLEGSGWIERRAQTRKDGGNTVNAYRVVLDGEQDAEPEDGSEQDPPASPVMQGAASPVRRGPPAHGRAGIETTLNKRDERERADEDGEDFDEAGLEAFRVAYPTTEVDDPVRVEAAWRSLSADERSAARGGVTPFLDALKAAKRTHVPGAEGYLRHRRWERAAAAAKVHAVATGKAETAWAAPWTKLFWACAVWAGRTGVSSDEMRKRARLAMQVNVGWRIDGPAMRADVAAIAETLAPVMTSDPHAKAWAGWLKDHGFDVDDKFGQGKPFWVFLPPDPPPKASDWSTDDDRLTG